MTLMHGCSLAGFGLLREKQQEQRDQANRSHNPEDVDVGEHCRLLLNQSINSSIRLSHRLDGAGSAAKATSHLANDLLEPRTVLGQIMSKIVLMELFAP